MEENNETEEQRRFCLHPSTGRSHPGFLSTCLNFWAPCKLRNLPHKLPSPLSDKCLVNCIRIPIGRKRGLAETPTRARRISSSCFAGFAVQVPRPGCISNPATSIVRYCHNPSSPPPPSSGPPLPCSLTWFRRARTCTCLAWPRFFPVRATHALHSPHPEKGKGPPTQTQTHPDQTRSSKQQERAQPGFCDKKRSAPQLPPFSLRSHSRSSIDPSAPRSKQYLHHLFFFAAVAVRSW
jgi:hypothetical protein